MDKLFGNRENMITIDEIIEKLKEEGFTEGIELDREAILQYNKLNNIEVEF